MILPSTISETQTLLINKTLTAHQLVEIYLARIEKFNPDLNAFITITKEQAYKEAKKVQQIIDEKGEKALVEYPLLGAVISYKDMYLTKGVRTTAASKVLESYIAPYSATVVDRLERAGAIMIGKTNCDAWAHGASGENSDFGPTKNPWNTDFVPGGSSSGSAVAVASDMSLISTGTDTGGSIRQPANFCGVVGFKPTYGAVPRTGVIAMASSLDSMGHFTRTVEDARRVFDVTKGLDGMDSTVANSTSPTTIGAKKRIGIPKEYFIDGLDKEVEKSVRDVTEVYKKQGYEIVEISLPHTKYGIAVYYIVMTAEVSSNLARYDGIRYGNDRETFGAEAKRRIMLGTFVLSSGYYDAYYAKAMKVRSKMIEDFEKAFNEVDAILAPVSPTPPFKLGEKTSDPLQMYLADVYTVSANLVGIPGLSIPCGFTKDGLPLGFQLMGPRFSEDTLFEMGELYQKHTDFHTKKPLI